MIISTNKSDIEEKDKNTWKTVSSLCPPMEKVGFNDNWDSIHFKDGRYMRTIPRDSCLGIEIKNDQIIIKKYDKVFVTDNEATQEIKNLLMSWKKSGKNDLTVYFEEEVIGNIGHWKKEIVTIVKNIKDVYFYRYGKFAYKNLTSFLRLTLSSME